jgi:class 3 adenylate cyclase
MKRDPWAGPLKVHLSLLIITLLIGVALPLIWLGYERGHSAAVAAAEQEMRLLTDRTVDRYRIVFGNAAPIVSMAAASEAFVKPPPAMGDTVNVASRLEGINKEFGTTIIVSRAVHDRCFEAFLFRPLGLKQAKGRSEEIELFELVGMRQNPERP